MSSANEVEVFRSDVPFEAEMIAEALEAEGIACFLRRELPGGLQLTMMETATPPGQAMVVLVPQELAERSRQVIATFRPPADVFDSPGEDELEPSSSGRSKPAKAYARILLFLMIIPLLIGLFLLLAAIFADL
jgi:putative signal transducing protein